MEGATHKHVVNLIKKGGDKLTLVVISVSSHEAEKLESESSSGGEYYDYTDKRAVPLSIPETRQVVSSGETYVVRNAKVCVCVVFFCMVQFQFCAEYEISCLKIIMMSSCTYRMKAVNLPRKPNLIHQITSCINIYAT